MKKDKFIESLKVDSEPDFGGNQQRLALWYLMKKKWDQAHAIVQDGNSEIDFWIHALLHKIEGDIGNSKYWYGLARRKYVQGKGVEEEVFEILESLAG